MERGFRQKSQLCRMIRFAPSANGVPETGTILVSEPFLDDPYFGRKAILLCEHNAEGSFGFVLNNFVEISLQDILDDLPEVQARISVGGPVKNSNLYYLHTAPDITGSIPVVDGVCMGGDFDIIKEKLRTGLLGPDRVRFFIGYAGWSPQQLEQEIRNRSWFITRANAQRIMETALDDDAFWKRMVEDMGDGYAHIANAPIDPSMN
jgi:putative transcriptional regulator